MRASLLLENVLWTNEVSYSGRQRADAPQMKSLPCRKTSYLLCNAVCWDLHCSWHLRVCPLWMRALMNSFQEDSYAEGFKWLSIWLGIRVCYWNPFCKYAYTYSHIHLYIVSVAVLRGENVMQVLYSFRLPGEPLAVKDYILAVASAQGKLFPVVFSHCGGSSICCQGFVFHQAIQVPKIILTLFSSEKNRRWVNNWLISCLWRCTSLVSVYWFFFF